MRAVRRGERLAFALERDDIGAGVGDRVTRLIVLLRAKFSTPDIDHWRRLPTLEI